ncbi:MAG: glycine zipper domain-containing protein [Verrucomicrobia bacterium]|nr:glycine zipper domain-containing protein [Verrucomicrobiota bacterium]
MRIITIFSALAIMLVASGCANTGQTSNTKRGAVGGAAAGAIIGGVIGHQSGRGLEGAAVGGALGGAGGAVLGNAKDEEAADK